MHLFVDIEHPSESSFGVQLDADAGGGGGITIQPETHIDTMIQVKTPQLRLPTVTIPFYWFPFTVEPRVALNPQLTVQAYFPGLVSWGADASFSGVVGVDHEGRSGTSFMHQLQHNWDLRKTNTLKNLPEADITLKVTVVPSTELFLEGLAGVTLNPKPYIVMQIGGGEQPESDDSDGDSNNDDLREASSETSETEQHLRRTTPSVSGLGPVRQVGAAPSCSSGNPYTTGAGLDAEGHNDDIALHLHGPFGVHVTIPILPSYSSGNINAVPTEPLPLEGCVQDTYPGGDPGAGGGGATSGLGLEATAGIIAGVLFVLTAVGSVVAWLFQRRRAPPEIRMFAHTVPQELQMQTMAPQVVPLAAPAIVNASELPTASSSTTSHTTVSTTDIQLETLQTSAPQTTTHPAGGETAAVTGNAPQVASAVSMPASAANSGLTTL
jgi:hypothetical protein